MSMNYLGDRGKEYFAYQNQGEGQLGRINARKFASYICLPTLCWISAMLTVHS